MTTASVSWSIGVPNCTVFSKSLMPAPQALAGWSWSATSTSSSGPSYSSMRGVGQPVEVVEAAVDVAALVERRALVAEQLPDLVVVVQRDHRDAADEREELGVGDLAQELLGDLGILRSPSRPACSRVARPCSRTSRCQRSSSSWLEDLVRDALVRAVGEVGMREGRSEQTDEGRLSDRTCRFSLPDAVDVTQAHARSASRRSAE